MGRVAMTTYVSLWDVAWLAMVVVGFVVTLGRQFVEIVVPIAALR